MKIDFIRHATFLLHVNGKQYLVDPMLSKKNAMDPVANAANTIRNPMVELPMSDDDLNRMLKNIDGVIVTHTHRDHWDARAAELLSKETLILCQPTDEEKIKGQGFTNVRPVSDSVELNNIKFNRTGGQHGTGETGKRMGVVSGFVIESGGQRLYIAGDTVWCAEVEAALSSFKPDFIVLNAGAAQFISGGPITMNVEDVIKVAQHQPKSTILPVHMETINHCLLNRAELNDALQKHGLSKRVKVPADGEIVTLS